MYQEPLPQYLLSLDDDAVHERVATAKRHLGASCVVLGHHYQRDEVIRHADYTGDSLKLAKVACSLPDARSIIFCGVHFMAETADIMTPAHQEVSLPDLGAGCDMADMAETGDVKQAFKDLDALGFTSVVPVTYVNSSAALKAEVGERGGVVCTSGNAEKVVSWALERGEHLFFFPDQHLGRNVCKKLGLSPEHDMLLWDPTRPLGGHDANALAAAKVWLWKGHCPVHALFTVRQIEKLRVEAPAMRIIVHPECAMEVVDLADASGSTEVIINTIAKAPSGSQWAVGTEKHLVERLAALHPDKKIVSLNQFTCLCATMNRISLRHLAWVLDDLVAGHPLRNAIRVPQGIATSAAKALERMFELS